MYAKLFSRITESSLMEEDVITRYVFLMLLAIADKVGLVVGTDRAIARRMNVPEDQFRLSMIKLMSPDEHSNNQDFEGRRVVESVGERGYKIVSYEVYRDMKDEEARREYMKGYMQEYRRKPKHHKPEVEPVNSVSSGKHIQMHATPTPNTQIKIHSSVREEMEKKVTSRDFSQTPPSMNPSPPNLHKPVPKGGA